MRSKSLLLTLVSGALLFVTGAQAQVSEGLEFVGEISGLEGGGNGHDKCKGKGHQSGRGGAGHDEGECDEDGTSSEPTGPVGETYCDNTRVDAESSWLRYSCTIVAYNENYFTDTVEANQAYVEGIVAASADFVGELQQDATDYGTTASAQVVAGDVTGAAQTTVDFLGGALDRYLPVPVPIGPGPAIDEVRAYSTEVATRVTTLDYEGAAQATVDFLGGALDRYLPVPVPIGPGPAITEAREYSTTVQSQITSGDYWAAAETTQVFAFGVAEGLPVPVPIGPGPAIKEYALPGR